MYCAACSLTVEQVLCGLPGVDGVQVNGATATARLIWQDGVSRPSDWIGALQRASVAPDLGLVHRAVGFE